MITVYGISGAHVARLRAALLKKELQFQHVSVNLRNKSEEFKKLSSVGKIPILEDEDGTVVWDSIHIVDYLDHKYPKTYKMFPQDPNKRALAWNAVALAENLSSYVGPLYVEKFGLKDGLRQNGMAHRAIVYDEQQKKDLNNAVSMHLDSIKHLYGSKEFITGSLSFGDVAIYGHINNLKYLGFDVSKMDAWCQKLAKDPAIANMFAPESEKGVKEI
jgi:glutathione S-transferase